MNCKDCNKKISKRAKRCNRCNLIFQYSNSNRAKRVSTSLLGTKHKTKRNLKERRIFVCKICKNNYKSIHEKSTCGNKECGRISNSLARIEAIKNGKVNNSKRYIYKFNNKSLRCDSKIEYACLNYFLSHYKVLDISRCDFSIEYNMKGKIRRFLPDFKITVFPNNIFIVEAKSTMGMKSTNEKWHMYNETQPYKKEALIKFCKENNYSYFWFTKNLHEKFYRELSLNG